MKKFLTIAMILGSIITLEAIQPVEAAITSPIVSSIDHSQVTPTWWRTFHTWHWHWWRR
ncbi:MAG: hypothetical protein HYX35_02455 [Proteobacteria bacterium]|nr:hypothetical protein [Pseudomonadota bacterium]